MLRVLRAAAQPVDLVWAANPASKAAAFARVSLGTPPGARCLLLHSLDAERVASQIGLALRRGGFVPVLSPLSVDAVTEQVVHGAAAALTRTGASFFVACGDSNVIDTVKMAAAVAANPGPLRAGGAETRAMRAPSLAALLVPAGPGGTAAVASSDVLCAGHTWVTVTPAAGSPLACLASPGTVSLLPDASPVLAAVAALADCVEAVGTPSRLSRRARLLALHGAARAACALWALATPTKERRGGDSSEDSASAAAANVAVASACGSIAAGAAALGAARGLARAVSSQYRVSHASAAAAVLPAVVRHTVDRLAEIVDDADHGHMQGSDDAMAVGVALSGADPSAAELLAWETGGGSEDDEDCRIGSDGGFTLPALPGACAEALRVAAASHAMTDCGATASSWTSLRRLALLAGVLGAVRKAAVPPALRSLWGQRAPMCPPATSSPGDVGGWTDACEALVTEVEALSAVAARLAPAALTLPAALGDADALRSVAEAAEVDAHTMGHAVPFSRTQLLEVLREAVPTARSSGPALR